MIARMSRENSARRKFDMAVLREAIAAGVKAHGAGKILSSEMPFVIGERQRTDLIRVAPKFTTPYASGTAPVPLPPQAYTIEGLAKFLGFVKTESQRPSNSFIAAFGAEELIADKVMTESQIKGLSAEKLGELVIALRKQRDAAKVETARLQAEAEKRKKEAEAKADELEKQKAEAETRRLAAIETERLAAIKRAEEKAKRDAEEKIRLAAEAKRKQVEAEQREFAWERTRKIPNKTQVETPI
jgi:hypothetical protein